MFFFLKKASERRSGEQSIDSLSNYCQTLFWCTLVLDKSLRDDEYIRTCLYPWNTVVVLVLSVLYYIHLTRSSKQINVVVLLQLHNQGRKRRERATLNCHPVGRQANSHKVHFAKCNAENFLGAVSPARKPALLLCSAGLPSDCNLLCVAHK